MKHAIIYDRASTESQKDNWSREDAARVGGELAQRYGFSSWEVRQEIKSGESITTRPILQGILDDIAAYKAHGLIVQNLSRLSRDEDMIDGAVIRSILRRCNVPVITPAKVYDFAQDSDEKASDIEFLLSKWYKQTLIANTVRGQHARASSGLNVSRPGYGYKLVVIGEKNGKPLRDLAVDESKRSVAQLIFDLVPVKGLRGTANELNSRGIPSPIGKTWKNQRIRRIVQNPLYAGFLTWGREIKSRHMRGFEQIQHYRPDLAIVSLEIWKRANEAVTERSAKHHKPGEWAGKYPFTGILACPVCGGPLYGRNSKVDGRKYKNYFCIANANRGPSVCKGPKISERIVKQALLPFVAQTLYQNLLVDDALDAATHLYGLTVTEAELKTKIESELHIVKESKNRLVKALAGGILSEGDVKDQMIELRDKEDSLKREMATISQKAKVREDFARAVEALRDKDILEVLEKLDSDALKSLLRLIFKPCGVLLQSDRRGAGAKAQIISYEFTEEFKEIILGKSGTLVFKKGHAQSGTLPREAFLGHSKLESFEVILDTASE